MIEEKIDMNTTPSGSPQPGVPNLVLLRGVVGVVLPSREVASGQVARLQAVVGRASTKTGRLTILVERWTRTDVPTRELKARTELVAVGGLRYEPGWSDSPRAIVLSAHTILEC